MERSPQHSGALGTTMETLLKAPAACALLRREWLGLYSTEASFATIITTNTALNTLALVLPLYMLVGSSRRTADSP